MTVCVGLDYGVWTMHYGLVSNSGYKPCPLPCQPINKPTINPKHNNVMIIITIFNLVMNALNYAKSTQSAGSLTHNHI